MLCFTGSRRQEWAGGKPRISSFVPLHSDSKCLDHATLASKPSDGHSCSHRVLEITKLVILDLHWCLLIWKVAKQTQHKQLYIKLLLDVSLNYFTLNLWQSLSDRGGTPALRSWMCHCSKSNTATVSGPEVLTNKNKKTISIQTLPYHLYVRHNEVGLFAPGKLYTTLKHQVQHLVYQDYFHLYYQVPAWFWFDQI